MPHEINLQAPVFNEAEGFSFGPNSIASRVNAPTRRLQTGRGMAQRAAPSRAGP